MGYALLAATIVFEVIAVNLLKWFSAKSSLPVLVGIIVSYLFCYVIYVFALDYIPLGIAYALWGGIGTALVAVVGWLVWKQPLNRMQIAGIAAIIVGVVLLGAGMMVAS